MRIFILSLSLVGFLLVAPSCKKKTTEVQELDVDSVFVDDDDDDDFGLGIDSTSIDSINTDTEAEVSTDSAQTTPSANTSVPAPKMVKATGVTTVNPAQAGKLMKYNVVISTLSKQDGVKRLSKSLDNAGINYFVVQTKGLYMFVVASTDSEEVAINARKEFLLKTTVDKSRQQIWRDFEIEITDTYILQK